MLPPPERQARLSAQEREIEAQLDFVAVVLIGPEKRQWRHPHDNRGFWPMKIGTTRDPKGYLRAEDKTWEHVIGHALVWVMGQERADKLQRTMEELMQGMTVKVREDRSFYDIDPEQALSFFDFAIETTKIEAFDHKSKRERIAWEKERRLRAMQRERNQRNGTRRNAG